MFLLDTHTLLWFLFNSEQLSGKAKDAICEADQVFVSIVSLWEIAIKQSIGKLELDESIEAIASVCRDKDIRIIGVRPDQIEAIKTLPDIHKDPFDRLLIAQAMVDHLTIITRDTKIAQYTSVTTFWN